MFPVIRNVPKKLIQSIFDLTFLLNYWLDFFQWTLNQILLFIHVCSIFLASFRSQFYISDCSIFSKQLFNVVPLNYQNQFYRQLQACFPINVPINSILPSENFLKGQVMIFPVNLTPDFPKFAANPPDIVSISLSNSTFSVFSDWIFTIKISTNLFLCSILEHKVLFLFLASQSW